jgi:glycosyltransferase involved in cell wall biosynthesis
MLRAFARAGADAPEAVLVCAGWGADIERSKQLIADLGIGERVRLLSYAMSKARLRRHYRAADIVADQFTVGSYGGSSLEAMSCGRPLLIHLAPERFTGPFSLPPVVNVSDTEAIAAELARLFADPESRARVGSQAREWTVANHGPVLVQRTLDLCRAVIDDGAAAP